MTLLSCLLLLSVGSWQRAQAAGKDADQPRILIYVEKHARVIMQSYIPVSDDSRPTIAKMSNWLLLSGSLGAGGLVLLRACARC